MKVIVITGSTRGIGYGLADSFLDHDCAVIVSGRTQESVDAAMTRLGARHDRERIHGWPCDVCDYGQVQALWDAAQARFGSIGIWINNAGVGQSQTRIWEQVPDDARIIIATNVIGTVNGIMVAIPGMLQQGSGALYNMFGAGSDGFRIPGLALYSTSKRAVSYLTKALVREVRDLPLIVGAISPGMVITDLITNQYTDRPQDWERAKRIFNLIADRVETVTPWLAERILHNRKNGATISWLTPTRALGRFLLSPFRKRDIFS
ncbi:MAG TPA: SDR family oxidoreductase [Anaerolineae bacterium]|nr:SDR family oxidoreductase [Anaerolineae bacterium]